MANLALASLPLLLMLAVPSASADEEASLNGVQLAQLHFQQWVVVRVMHGGNGPVPMPPPTPVDPAQWREKHSEKCVKTDRLASAQILRPDAVDLLLDDGKRLRSQLETNCPAVLFYAGFYIKPEKDGKVCAKRDATRMRSGGQCRILALHTLAPPK